MKKIWKVLLWIFAVIGAIIVIIIASVFLGTTGVKSAANDVMAQFHQGQIESLYKESPLSQEMDFSKFATAMGIGTTMDITKSKLIKRQGRGFENGEKYIYGNFKFTNGKEEVLTLWFQKVDGELVRLGITPGEPEDTEE
ncbi:MAG: hypothetical protein GXP45_01685 [bacterium]|nr:hypothetical protein [bacterium]